MMNTVMALMGVGMLTLSSCASPPETLSLWKLGGAKDLTVYRIEGIQYGGLPDSAVVMRVNDFWMMDPVAGSTMRLPGNGGAQGANVQWAVARREGVHVTYAIPGRNNLYVKVLGLPTRRLPAFDPRHWETSRLQVERYVNNAGTTVYNNFGELFEMYGAPVAWHRFDPKYFDQASAITSRPLDGKVAVYLTRKNPERNMIAILNVKTGQMEKLLPVISPEEETGEGLPWEPQSLAWVDGSRLVAVRYLARDTGGESFVLSLAESGSCFIEIRRDYSPEWVRYVIKKGRVLRVNGQGNVSQ